MLGETVGFAWAVLGELRTTAQNEINLVLGRHVAQETQNQAASNVNASHHFEDTHPLVTPLQGAPHANYMTVGITDSSSHIV